MSVRETLVKHLSTILRASKGTIMALLSDENGLSIAKAGRSSDIELDSNAITSVSSAAFSSSEENWNDLGIREQIIAFSFFEKICLITIRIQNTLLTIVHDYNQEWPLNADSIGSSMYYLRKEIDTYFGSGDISDTDIEFFSNKVRSAIYLCGMGTEIQKSSYIQTNFDKLDLMKNISNILDSATNPVFLRHGLVNASGLNIDARDANPSSFPISVDAFSANANVGFQKMVEEANSMNIGGLISYLCVAGANPDNYYGILCSPSGKLTFSDPNTKSEIVQPITFISLFPLMYGAIPVLCEARNMVYSILKVIGNDVITEKFINSVSAMVKARFQ
jgi:hypothetical protein